MTLREKKLLNRVNDRVKLSREEWNMVIDDFKNNVGNREISRKYNIKLGYLKHLKRIIGVR